MNVQISLNGLQKIKTFPDEFPYEAINPYTGEHNIFESMEDVNEVIFQCYLECINKGFNRLGEALYQQAQMFVNMDKLLDTKKQLMIKQYQFCKKFNCPPYTSLQDTPIETIESFMIIDEEINNYKTKDQNG